MKKDPSRLNSSFCKDPIEQKISTRKVRLAASNEHVPSRVDKTIHTNSTIHHVLANELGLFCNVVGQKFVVLFQEVDLQWAQKIATN
jgi:hypothetical protein